MRQQLNLILAAMVFLPALMLAAPVVLYTDWRWGRGNASARKAEHKAMSSNLMLRSFLWAHRLLCCGGQAAAQKW